MYKKSKTNKFQVLLLKRGNQANACQIILAFRFKSIYRHSARHWKHLKLSILRINKTQLILGSTRISRWIICCRPDPNHSRFSRKITLIMSFVQDLFLKGKLLYQSRTPGSSADLLLYCYSFIYTF